MIVAVVVLSVAVALLSAAVIRLFLIVRRMDEVYCEDVQGLMLDMNDVQEMFPNLNRKSRERFVARNRKGEIVPLNPKGKSE